MRALIFTHGTRGDVQPYAALARTLERAGHEAVLAAPAAAAELVKSHGLRFFPLADGPMTLLQDPQVREGIETNYRGLRGKALALRVMRRVRPLLAHVAADMAASVECGADIVVHNPGVPGHHVAEALGIPAVPAGLQPVWVPTRAFRNPMLPLPLPRALNRASYLAIKLLVHTMGGVSDQLRDELGLPRRRGRHDFLRRPDGGPAPVLHGFSRHILPPDTDYPAWVRTTGFWFLPAAPDWTPPAALADFLAAGEPPVYVGFGSMAGTDPHRLGRVVADAARLAKVRVVLATGWGGIQLDEPPPNVLRVTDVPHDWLFDRVAAVVHHGGSGTTGAALAAGKPQVVCPFAADQPFWATRMHTAGVAPAPLPPRLLTAPDLAAAIRHATTNPATIDRAAALGHHVRTEDGVTTAVRVLESITSTT